MNGQRCQTFPNRFLDYTHPDDTGQPQFPDALDSGDRESFPDPQQAGGQIAT